MVNRLAANPHYSTFDASTSNFSSLGSAHKGMLPPDITAGPHSKRPLGEPVGRYSEKITGVTNVTKWRRRVRSHYAYIADLVLNRTA